MNRTIKIGLVAWFLLSVLQSGAQSAGEKAWSILQEGQQKKNEEKITAVRVLGLIQRNQKAADLALAALNDTNSDVRAAAAKSLGQMGAKSAIPRLKTTLHDEKDVSVVVSCAWSLVTLGDPLGYGVYYAVLTGQKKSGGGLLDDQKKMLHDPKKMAEFGIDEGIGFIPFAGLGKDAFKMLTKDDSSPVRAAAAGMLEKDPDPKTRTALISAASDDSWQVRVAALNVLSHRGDPTVIVDIQPLLYDKKDEVRYTAAAAVVHLEDVRMRKSSMHK
ncbi:HEAT repeat domain-containing protein [Terracidiphilus gabretensis]|uniref:HEAT repeat domain-containing protein n=1 Tax=Terracidiphilus gabretensis TaxID=1577687 RepID=UPI00071BD70F|nr:HEAT repeat domain-containing protein [Terracidiphilus gabretensis]